MITNHKKNFMLFCNYLEQDIDTPLCQELLQHIEECPECRHNIATIRKTVALYRESLPKGEFPQQLKQRLFEKIKAKH